MPRLLWSWLETYRQHFFRFVLGSSASLESKLVCKSPVKFLSLFLLFKNCSIFSGDGCFFYFLLCLFFRLIFFLMSFFIVGGVRGFGMSLPEVYCSALFSSNSLKHCHCCSKEPIRTSYLEMLLRSILILS